MPEENFTMRNAFATLCGLSAVGSLLLAGPTQAARRSEMEKSLLGIRVLQTYRNVMALYGMPTRIYRFGETVLTVPSVDANGNPTGGIRALDTAGNGSMTAGFGGGGLMGGMPGMGRMGGGMPGMPPGMMSGGPMGSMSGAPVGMPPSMMQGYQAAMNRGAGGPGMGGPSLPGMSGPMGGRGAGGGMPGMPGSMGGATGRGPGGSNLPQSGGPTFAQSGGFMWVYFYPKQELMYWFLFNTDGRVVAIVEKGKNQGKPTSRGISLGSAVKSVYEQYGWPNSMDRQGDAIALHYNIRSHVQFQIINNKVTEVAVFLTEDQHAIESDTVGGRGGMGAGGMGGLAGGRGGMGRPSLGVGGGGMRPSLSAGGGSGGAD